MSQNSRQNNMECLKNHLESRMNLSQSLLLQAPRAKMNQQRSRRFRASKETGEKIEMMASIKQDLMARGCHVPPEKSKGDHFDSNCITPVRPKMV